MAEEQRKQPALPQSFKVTNAGTPASPASQVLGAPAPTWTKGDEWSFASEGPTGKSTFVWTVDREESVDGVPYYVIKTGSREIFYRKSDLAASRETVNGAIVSQSFPARIRYVFPLAVGATWEQTYRTERPVDRQTSDIVSAVTVAAEETVTVPAGTFRTFKIVYRHKRTGAVYYEEWYSPEVNMLVRGHERLESGSRTRELTAYRRNSVAR